MRLLHTSDWHLGQTFYQHQRQYEHGCFLDWLGQQIAAKQPDALIVAGDIFDTVNPPISAQRMLYQFLALTHRRHPQLTMILIAGNHDSGGRIELPAPLLDAMNTVVVGRVGWQDDDKLDVEHLLIPVKNQQAEVLGWCLALPYLRPAEVTAGGTGLDTMAAIADVHQRLIAAATAKQNGQQPLVLISHAHMQGASTSPDSERNIVIGNAEALSTQLFSPAVDYVALGHLHKPQQVGEARIRYSGSPIPLSFSERHYKHQVLCVDVVAGQPVQIEPLLIPRAVPMLRMPSSGDADLPDVLSQLSALDLPVVEFADARPWLEVVVTLDGPPPPDLRQQIEGRLDLARVRLVRLRHQQAHRPSSQTDQAASTVMPDALPQPQQLFEQVWQQLYGELDPAVMADFGLLMQMADAEIDE